MQSTTLRRRRLPLPSPPPQRRPQHQCPGRPYLSRRNRSRRGHRPRLRILRLLRLRHRLGAGVSLRCSSRLPTGSTAPCTPLPSSPSPFIARRSAPCSSWHPARFSREIKLTIALFLLGTATVAISFLPTYSQLGTSFHRHLLPLLRIGQGVAQGGSWDGLPSLLALNAPSTSADGTRCWDNLAHRSASSSPPACSPTC
jgi:hypothetical protein